MSEFSSGIYRGIIVDNKDPQNKGRCRVKILGKNLPSQTKEDLFWAEVVTPIGGNDTINYLYVPPVNTKVFVSFINGSEEQPVIIGYWRTEGNKVLQDYEKYFDKENFGMLYLKMGEKETSPVLKFDSFSERLEIGTKGNFDVWGASRHLFGEDGNSSLSLDKDKSSLNFFKLVNQSRIDLNKSGTNITTTKTLNFNVGKKRVAVIGKGFLSGLIDGQLQNFGLTSENKGVGDSPEKVFGDKLYKKIQNTISSSSYDNKKNLFQNLLKNAKSSAERKEIKKLIKNIPSSSKNLVSKMFSHTASASQMKDLVSNKLSKGLKSVKSNLTEKIFGKTKVADLLIVSGNKKTNIFGKEERQITSDYSITTIGDYSLKVMGKTNWLLNKDFKTMISIGDLSFTFGTGEAEYNFVIPLKKLTIKQATPVSQPDQLVKKKAFEELKSLVYELMDYMAQHQHIGNLGAPTTPALIPYPFAVKSIPLRIKMDIMDMLPSPANMFFTNNLEAS